LVDAQFVKILFFNVLFVFFYLCLHLDGCVIWSYGMRRSFLFKFKFVVETIIFRQLRNGPQARILLELCNSISFLPQIYLAPIIQSSHTDVGSHVFLLLQDIFLLKIRSVLLLSIASLHLPGILIIFLVVTRHIFLWKWWNHCVVRFKFFVSLMTWSIITSRIYFNRRSRFFAT